MKYYLFLLIFLFFCDFSYSENILGLTVPCDDCQFNQNPCSIVIEAAKHDCNSGLVKLLKPLNSNGPSYGEIRKYLSENEASEAVLRELLRLLESTKVEANDSTEQVGIIDNFIKHNQPLLPRAKFLLTQAIEQVTFSKFESSRRKLIREDSLAALESISAGDTAILQALSLLLAKSAEEAIIEADVERANWLLAKSKAVYADLYQQRDLLVEELRQHPLLKQKSPIVITKEVFKKKISTPRRMKLFVLVAVALWLIFLISYYFFTKKPLPKEKRVPKKVDSKEDEILKFFDLDENSTEEDLNRNYRKMAKAVHPDVGKHGLNYDFHKLQDMFEQARRLIFHNKG